MTGVRQDRIYRIAHREHPSESEQADRVRDTVGAALDRFETARQGGDVHHDELVDALADAVLELRLLAELREINVSGAVNRRAAERLDDTENARLVEATEKFGGADSTDYGVTDD